MILVIAIVVIAVMVIAMRDKPSLAPTKTKASDTSQKTTQPITAIFGVGSGVQTTTGFAQYYAFTSGQNVGTSQVQAFSAEMTKKR